MESELEAKQVFNYTDIDPQRQAVYDREKRMCAPVSGERIDQGAAQSIVEALWEKHVELPVRPPDIVFDQSVSQSSYYAWEHKITIKSSSLSVPTISLIHELAHAKLGALGIGPFVESHGPLFLRVFGQMWSTYSTEPYEKFANRSGDLQIADSLPNLDEYSWAVVVEGGRNYAVRPATRAVEIGWNVHSTFSLNIQDNHPYGS
jgi:hypothetical protein